MLQKAKQLTVKETEGVLWNKPSMVQFSKYGDRFQFSRPWAAVKMFLETITHCYAKHQILSWWWKRVWFVDDSAVTFLQRFPGADSRQIFLLFWHLLLKKAAASPNFQNKTPPIAFTAFVRNNYPSLGILRILEYVDGLWQCLQWRFLNESFVPRVGRTAPITLVGAGAYLSRAAINFITWASDNHADDGELLVVFPFENYHTKSAVENLIPWALSHFRTEMHVFSLHRIWYGNVWPSTF